MSEVRELTPIVVEDRSAGRMEIVDGLCGLCSHILNNLDLFIQNPDSLDEEPPFSHHSSIFELRKSAKDGCSLCALFIGDANHDNHRHDSIPVAHVEINEGDSEANERRPNASEGGISEVDIQDVKSGSSNIDTSYTNQGATGGISFSIYHAKYTPQGHLAWIVRHNSVIAAAIHLSPVSHPGLCSYIPRNRRLIR